MRALTMAFAAGMMGLAMPALANTPAWMVSEASGQVSVLRAGVSRIALRGGAVAAGDFVVTGKSGRAVLTRGEEYVVVAPGSKIQIADPKQSGGFTQIIENFGNVIFKIKKKATPHFAVQTPWLAAVVKGTTFSVTVTEKGASVQVVEGRVQVESRDGGATHLTLPGEIATIRGDQPYRLTVQGGATPLTINSPNVPADDVRNNPAPMDEPGETKPSNINSEVTDTPSVASPFDGRSGGFDGPTSGAISVFETAILAPISEGPVALETVSGGLVTGDSSLSVVTNTAAVVVEAPPVQAAQADIAAPAPVVEVVSVAPAAAPVMETPAPAPVVEVATVTPAATPVVEAPAPAPVVEVAAATPAAAPVVEAPAPAPAVEVATMMPAATAVVEAPAPAPIVEVAAAAPAATTAAVVEAPPASPVVEVASVVLPPVTTTTESASTSPGAAALASTSGSGDDDDASDDTKVVVASNTSNSGSSSNSGSGSNSGSSNSGSSNSGSNSGSSNSGSSNSGSSNRSSGSGSSGTTKTFAITIGRTTFTLTNNNGQVSSTRTTSATPSAGLTLTNSTTNQTGTTTSTTVLGQGQPTTTTVTTPVAGN